MLSADEYMRNGEQTQACGKFKPGQSGCPSKVFSSKNQPSGAAKSLGKLKMKRGVELIRSLLDLQGKENLRERKLVAEYFAVSEDQISVEVLMLLVQMRKAIQKGDSHSFAYIMDRLYGKPSQPSQVELSEGEPNTFLYWLKKSCKTNEV